MTPTVLKKGNYRLFFFSREEDRIHIHITCSDGEAKFWLEPIISLATFHGLSKKQLKELQKIVEEQENAIKKAWTKHFKS